MTDLSPSVEQQLIDYASSRAHSRVGRTIGALLRSDRDRLQFWDGGSAVQHLAVQGTYSGDEELCVMFAAERYANMRACIGYVMVDGYGPMPGAWLTLNGSVIDPAGKGRNALGFYGVELGHVERANWTPTQRHAVAERGVSRLAV
jgi:hypothetical protein